MRQLLNFDRSGKGSARLSGRSMARLVNASVKRAGIGPTAPHGLRHSAITALIDNDGDMVTAQKFARHRSPEETQRYYDNAADAAGEATTVSSALDDAIAQRAEQ